MKKRVKKMLFLLTALLICATAHADPIVATPIENLSTYEGNDPYVFDMTSRKYYAFNNLGVYEEFGLYPEVNTLKIAGGGVTEIEYIATLESKGVHPYINTDYIPKANTKLVLDVDIANSTARDWMAVFGSRQGGWTSHAFVLFARAWGDQKGCYNRTGDEHKADSDIPRDQRIIIEAYQKNCSFTLYGQPTPAVTITTNDGSVIEDCTNHLFLFDTNTGGANEDRRDNSYVYMKLYGCKIYEGETLVRDFVPIVDTEGNGGLKDKVTGAVVYSASADKFSLSPDGEELASAAGISVYPGKLVINTTDNHEYKWNGTEWKDLGSVYKPITDANYQNMNNWTCRFDGYGNTFGHIVNDGNNNFFNPYNGEGGWEPYQCRVEGLTRGETYRVSFNFTSSGWYSWSSYTTLPFFVSNNWNFGREVYPTSAGGEILGVVGLPQVTLTNQPYSFTFVADGTEAVLAIQFGVGSDDPDFYFHFDNLNIEFVDYPEKYTITWEDPNKYTPLAYIESTGAARENVFTTPYAAKQSTEVNIKFQSYSGGDWRAIFSGRNGQDSGNGISLYQNSNQLHFGYFVGGYKKDDQAPYPGHNQDITVAASLGNLNVNGTDYPTGQTTFNSSSRNISIFANPEWDNAFRGRIYYITLKENGETVYDFQPVLRHDGIFGYYDAATATFLQPVRGSYDGYGYKKLDDQAYITYSNELRIVIVGTSTKFLPEIQNLDNVEFTWTSSDEDIATVAADGTVTGKKAGKVIITATTEADRGWTTSYELTVSEPNYVRHDANGVGYAIVTGGNGWGDSPLSALIDNDATTKFGCSNTSDAWAIIIASEPVAVKQYSFVTGSDTYANPGRTPRAWKLEGSNDNQTWTTIDEQTQNYKAKTANKEETVFSVNDNVAYKFFKFSASQFDGGFQLSELWINEQTHSWASPTETVSTCTVEGSRVWECFDCHALKSVTLPLAAHDYENGVCSVCNAKESHVVYWKNGATTPFIAKYRHATVVSGEDYVDVEEGWANAYYDDSDWDELVLPLGTYGPYKTRWIAEYNTFWFRRTFEVADPSLVTKLTVKAVHDDDYAVFVNGTKVANESGWTANENDWRVIDVDPSLLVAGTNVLAIYIEQNFGGAYCDFSLEADVINAVIDENADYVAEEKTDAVIKLNRTFNTNDGAWNTFVVPFNISNSELQRAFGEDVAVAEYSDSGDPESVTVHFDTMKEPAVKANTPVLLKTNTTATEFIFEADVVAVVGDPVKAGTNFDLVGSYAASMEIAKGDYFLNDHTLYKSAGETTLKGTRAYLKAKKAEAARIANIVFDDEEGVVTGITEIATEKASERIYNLSGQKVNAMQRKGLYIKDGKKVMK